MSKKSKDEDKVTKSKDDDKATKSKGDDKAPKEKKSEKSETLTTAAGAPIGNMTNELTVGPRGPVLMQDFIFMDELSHFNHERIPERVVHARGAGAHGYFEVTKDITKYCKAKIFEKVGKKTDLFIRFSTVGGERGSADTVRDTRGFAIRFYTEDGNWDLVGINSPVFFIRDAILFPSLVHSQKRHPKTNVKDADMFWDFASLRPESTHQITMVFTGRGTPDGYRHMHGYGAHTFKMVNHKGEAVYCKFHFLTKQGIKNLTGEEAERLAGTDPDYAQRDLYDSIAAGEHPEWTCYLQVMTFGEAEVFRWNPFDLTKIWPHQEYPLHEFGRIVLNRNPENYFAEVEQAAFSPAHMIPGIEPSPDKVLQGRLFAYSDTNRYRVGSNYLQLPINCPMKTKVHNYQRDGPMCFNNQGTGAPNYFPNSFSGPGVDSKYLQSTFAVSGDVARYSAVDDDHFSQVGMLWKQLKADDQTELVHNIASNLCHAQEFIQKRAVENFTKANKDYGTRVQELLATKYKQSDK